MLARYIIALDQGTTSSRAVLYDRQARCVDMVSKSFSQIYPQHGWVEHNPHEIAFSQMAALTELVYKHQLKAEDIAAIGLDNQRETTIVWDPETGEPIYNAIVWQCRRSSSYVEKIGQDESLVKKIQEKTGLLPDAYFSATKLMWLFDHVEGAREKAQNNGLYFGTVDTYLLWLLSGGMVHVTDYSNASRTMLFNIHTLDWDDELLEIFGIPKEILPKIQPSASYFAETSYPGLPVGIPIMGVAGDQQAALFGQLCFEAGQAKNTYGTGCFLLMNTGSTIAHSEHKLLSSVAATAPGEPCQYVLEGSVFMAGALIQWLRDDLGLIRTAAESEALAQSVSSNGGVYVVPAHTGLGAPWWNSEAKGLICGLGRDTKAAHIVRASLEALAYQSADLVSAMEKDAESKLELLKVDGGAAANNFLMQYQADILGIDIVRPQNLESSSLGAAFLAGLSAGFWPSKEELLNLQLKDASHFRPNMDVTSRETALECWHKAVGRCL